MKMKRKRKMGKPHFKDALIVSALAVISIPLIDKFRRMTR